MTPRICRAALSCGALLSSVAGCCPPETVTNVAANDVDFVDAPEAAPAVVSGPTVRVTWDQECLSAVVQAYRGGLVIFPAGDPHEESTSGVAISIEPRPAVIEIKVWQGSVVQSGWLQVQ